MSTIGDGSDLPPSITENLIPCKTYRAFVAVVCVFNYYYLKEKKRKK